MGRRALPKLDPLIDLSSQYREWESVPKPWSGEALFGRTAPLELEIGSGKGLFLAAAGQMRPEHNFLGVEIAKKYARHAAARCARAGLSNVVVIGGDGRPLLAEVLPDAAVRAVHIYFPDPWWKKRHHKRRLMNPQFLAQVWRVLERDGRLHFWTDVEEYFVAALETIRESTRFHGPLPVPEKPPEHDLDYRTHFERRMRKHGLPVFRSEFVKQDAES